ncbi:MAP kinase phosphatase [Pelomyxa schiedti]|nr:MAP kinase phosphatase [Pelomyxa schiedti]
MATTGVNPETPVKPVGYGTTSQPSLIDLDDIIKTLISDQSVPEDVLVSSTSHHNYICLWRFFTQETSSANTNLGSPTGSPTHGTTSPLSSSPRRPHTPPGLTSPQLLSVQTTPVFLQSLPVFRNDECYLAAHLTSTLQPSDTSRQPSGAITPTSISPRHQHSSLPLPLSGAHPQQPTTQQLQGLSESADTTLTPRGLHHPFAHIPHTHLPTNPTTSSSADQHMHTPHTTKVDLYVWNGRQACNNTRAVATARAFQLERLLGGGGEGCGGCGCCVSSDSGNKSACGCVRHGENGGCSGVGGCGCVCGCGCAAVLLLRRLVKAGVCSVVLEHPPKSPRIPTTISTLTSKLVLPHNGSTSQSGSSQPIVGLMDMLAIEDGKEDGLPSSSLRETTEGADPPKKKPVISPRSAANGSHGVWWVVLRKTKRHGSTAADVQQKPPKIARKGPVSSNPAMESTSEALPPPKGRRVIPTLQLGAVVQPEIQVVRDQHQVSPRAPTSPIGAVTPPSPKSPTTTSPRSPSPTPLPTVVIPESSQKLKPFVVPKLVIPPLSTGSTLVPTASVNPNSPRNQSSLMPYPTSPRNLNPASPRNLLTANSNVKLPKLKIGGTPIPHIPISSIASSLPDSNIKTAESTPPVNPAITLRKPPLPSLSLNLTGISASSSPTKLPLCKVPAVPLLNLKIAQTLPYLQPLCAPRGPRGDTGGGVVVVEGGGVGSDEPLKAPRGRSKSVCAEDTESEVYIRPKDTQTQTPADSSAEEDDMEWMYFDDLGYDGPDVETSTSSSNSEGTTCILEEGSCAGTLRVSVASSQWMLMEEEEEAIEGYISGTTYRKCLEAICPIVPHIFLSGAIPTSDQSQLQSLGITHIMNCAASTCDNNFPALFNYWSLALHDSCIEDIHPLFLDVIEWIENVEKHNGQALIHCHAGASRSASIVMSYLIWKLGHDFRTAHEYVREKRVIVSPHGGFCDRLLLWSSIVHTDASRGICRLYRIVPQYASLHKPLLVGKHVDKFSASSFDPRACFVLHNAKEATVFAWIGAYCKPFLLPGLRKVTSQIQRYLKATTLVEIQQGEEPTNFLSLIPGCNGQKELFLSGLQLNVQYPEYSFPNPNTPYVWKFPNWDTTSELAPPHHLSNIWVAYTTISTTSTDDCIGARAFHLVIWIPQSEKVIATFSPYINALIQQYTTQKSGTKSVILCTEATAKPGATVEETAAKPPPSLPDINTIAMVVGRAFITDNGISFPPITPIHIEPCSDIHAFTTIVTNTSKLSPILRPSSHSPSPPPPARLPTPTLSTLPSPKTPLSPKSPPNSPKVAPKTPPASPILTTMPTPTQPQSQPPPLPSQPPPPAPPLPPPKPARKSSRTVAKTSKSAIPKLNLTSSPTSHHVNRKHKGAL